MRRVLLLLGLAGCPGYVKLNPADVHAVFVAPSTGARNFCVNGALPQMKAIVQLSGGKQAETWHFGRDGGRVTEGHLEFTAFQWSSDGGTVDEEGHLALVADPV